MNDVAQSLQQVREQIRQAAEQAGRDPADVRLLAVSKTKPADLIRQAADCGQRCFGENYLQEALDKVDTLSDLPLEWHFIGPIQSNKTRPIAEHFHWVHSVEREKIARRLSEQRPDHLPELNLCLQVNVSGEASKSGCRLDELSHLAEQVASLPGIRLRGLMAIPAAEKDYDRQRAVFARVREAFEGLQQQGHALDTLSMGMSGDLQAAIMEGATIVRIGTAVFGARDYAARPAG